MKVLSNVEDAFHVPHGSDFLLCNFLTLIGFPCFVIGGQGVWGQDLLSWILEPSRLAAALLRFFFVRPSLVVAQYCSPDHK